MEGGGKMRKALLVIFIAFLLLSVTAFADRTDADNETHSWNSVIDGTAGGYLQECKSSTSWEGCDSTMKQPAKVWEGALQHDTLLQDQIHLHSICTTGQVQEPYQRSSFDIYAWPPY
ncbi:MAG: hypothetical protein XD56_2111 [Pseudothermotoga lettingae]|nr:MAG: hypothetical protein XD56_2111 [Pseudothermotoga lettingae]